MLVRASLACALLPGPGLVLRPLGSPLRALDRVSGPLYGLGHVLAYSPLWRLAPMLSQQGSQGRGGEPVSLSYPRALLLQAEAGPFAWERVIAIAALQLLAWVS